jgi:hypothetical protein
MYALAESGLIVTFFFIFVLLGEPLTPDSLSQLYKKINDLYYGDCSSLETAESSSSDNSNTNSVSKFPHKLKASSQVSLTICVFCIIIIFRLLLNLCEYHIFTTISMFII